MEQKKQQFIRNSGRSRHCPAWGTPPGSRSACCAEPARRESPVGSLRRGLPNIPRTVAACRCSMGCPRRKVLSGGWPTCGYPPTHPSDWRWNTPTMRWTGHDGYRRSGCVPPLAPPPGFQPGPFHLKSVCHPNTGSCHRLETPHGGTRVRFQLPTWPSQPRRHWISWWMLSGRPRSFPILGIPTYRPWGRKPPPFPEEGV